MTKTFEVHEVQRVGRLIERVVRPSSLRQALQGLREHPGARPLAGGTDLFVDLQRDSTSDEAVVLIDLTTIPGFASIIETDELWILGAGVRHNQVVAHQGIRQTALPLAQACLEIGSPQLRNRATLAGNVATASPANDSLSALMALGAVLELSSLDEQSADAVTVREVAVADFFTGVRQTVLQPGELISAIRVPKLAASERGIWVKLGLRRAQAISVVHAGMIIGLHDDQTVSSARLALGSVAPTVTLSSTFEQALLGSTLNDETIETAALAVAAQVDPITDGRATAHYRRNGVRELVQRALRVLADSREAVMWPDQAPILSTVDQLEATAPLGATTLDSSTPLSIEVNGESVTGPGAPMLLLDWVREVAGLTGMKEGCAEGECGACTMLIDGSAVMSCLVGAAQADQRSVTTVEGLATDSGPHRIQSAFISDFAVQCGYCIPGFLVSGARLLDEIDEPTDEQIRHALSGNLCRCTGYYPITQAIKNSAVTIRSSND